jgi:23S rRNA pseudouridine2605 synthase
MVRSTRRAGALAKASPSKACATAIEAVLDRNQGDNSWITMALTEGKNREIRKICGHFGWPVSRLIRVAYGPFQLGSHLNPGDIEEVPAKVLREQVGANKVHKVSAAQAEAGTARGAATRKAAD